MQCLIRTEPFSEAILKLDPDKSTPLISGFIKTIKEYTTKKTAKVADIHKRLAKTDKLFTVGRMSDSFFALCKIITLMTEEIKVIDSSTPRETSDETHSSISRETSDETHSETPGESSALTSGKTFGKTSGKTSDETLGETLGGTRSLTHGDTSDLTSSVTDGKNPADVFKHSLVNRSICYVMISSMS